MDVIIYLISNLIYFVRYINQKKMKRKDKKSLLYWV